MREFLVAIQSHITLITIIEIVILTFFFYQIQKWIAGTQAEKVIKGLVVLLFLLPVSDFFGLTTLSYLLRNMYTWIFFIIIVVCQPELRTALEQIGNSSLINGGLFRNSTIRKIEDTINTVVSAVEIFANTDTGALIVCTKGVGLKDIEESGTILDAQVSLNLILNIFFDKSPLHDGAVIIDIDKNLIEAAGCVLPLTERKNLPTVFGTRHRAGIGIAEKSDALTIIVSEETGNITLTQNKMYRPEVSLEELKKELYSQFVKPYENEPTFTFKSFKNLNKNTGNNE